MRAILLAFMLIGCALFAILRFVVPTVTHRWAIDNIYGSGGAVLFREDYQPNSGSIYSPDNANPWRDVAIVHARNDKEAVAVARELKHLPEAECMFLGGVSDTGLTAICDSEPGSAFDTLDLLFCPITATGLTHLAKLTQLRTLFFNTCPIDDASLATLKSLDGLQNLILLEEGNKAANPNRFTEAGFRELGQMKHLEYLWLAQLHVSAASASHLKGMTGLKRLRLSRRYLTSGDESVADLRLISDETIADLRRSLPNCKIEVFPPDPSPPEKR